jgi:hypothetical protein
MTRSMYVILAAALACGPATTAVSRFDDDYEAARLQVVRSRLPLAAEVWAPW